MIARELRSHPVWILTALALCSSGCGTEPLAPRTAGTEPRPRLAPGRLTIHDDPAYLESRLVRESRALAVRAPHGSDASKTLSVQLELTGHVLAPEVDGHIVQANDIDLDPLSRIAIIGYNMAGDVFAGAFQVVDFQDAAHPVLLVEVLCHDADVTAVLKRGVYYYVGLSSSDPSLATPAMLREFKQSTAGFAPTGQWLALPSWAVTDLAGTGNSIVAACGAQNGAHVLIDRTTMHITGMVSEDDARGVAFDAAGTLFGVSGPGSWVRRTLPALAEQSRVAVSGYGLDAAKGSIEVSGAFCYLGAGDGGFQVRDTDGTLLGALENQAFLGHEPGLAVTNAVSVRTNLAFVAAGALGVEVVDLGRFWSGAPAGSTQGLSVTGSIDFNDGTSSNMVKARSNILVVAAGLDGVHLVRMI